MKTLFNSVPAFLILAAAGLIALTLPLRAAPPGLSEGCMWVNEPDSSAPTDFRFYEADFYAGEQVTVTASDPSGGATTFTVEFGGSVRTASIPGSITLSVAPGSEFGLGYYTNDGEAVFTDTCSAGSGAAGTGGGGDETPLPSCWRGDGRLNDAACGAPAAVYCNDYGGVDVYKLDPSGQVWELRLRVTGDEIGAPTGENRSVKEMGDSLVSQLGDGTLQLNTFYADGKPYIITWNSCVPGSVQIIAH